jgi:hypothetical protein
LADIILGVDAEAVRRSGAEGGFGLVYDTDDPSASGLYGTFGPALGWNLGAAVVGGFALRDIEGIAYNIDANIGPVTVVASFDNAGFNGLTAGWGRGAGASVSAMPTGTVTFREAVLAAAGFLFGLVSPEPALPPTDPCE